MWVETKSRCAYINITPQVKAAIKKSGVQEGLVLVNAMHIIASVYINDDESGLLKDYDEFLEKFVPHEVRYRHNETGKIALMPISSDKLWGGELPWLLSIDN